MRRAEIKRDTLETKINLTLELDGKGQSQIATGIGFFDHMMTHIAKHGFFDLCVEAKGDLEVDCHHTVEDIGIVLGKAIAKALGDKKGIRRYGSFLLPMDEALILCSMDISGRPYLGFDVTFTCDRLGEMDTEMVEEFFRAVSENAGITLHIRQLAGKNNHHIAEGIFKAFAKALDVATSMDDRIEGVLSTKGMLEG